MKFPGIESAIFWLVVRHADHIPMRRSYTHRNYYGKTDTLKMTPMNSGTWQEILKGVNKRNDELSKILPLDRFHYRTRWKVSNIPIFNGTVENVLTKRKASGWIVFIYNFSSSQNYFYFQTFKLSVFFWGDNVY